MCDFSPPLGVTAQTAVTTAISMQSNEITASVPVTVESFSFVFVAYIQSGMSTVAGVSSVHDCIFLLLPPLIISCTIAPPSPPPANSLMLEVVLLLCSVANSSLLYQWTPLLASCHGHRDKTTYWQQPMTM